MYLISLRAGMILNIGLSKLETTLELAVMSAICILSAVALVIGSSEPL